MKIFPLNSIQGIMVLVVATAVFTALGGAISSLEDRIRNTAGYTKLMKSIDENNISLSTLLIKQQKDINRQAANGLTPLMLASYRGPYEIVDLLLKNGANLDTKTNYGHTALACSTIGKKWDVTSLLLSWGADVSYIPNIDSNDNPPIISAVYENQLNILKKLLDAGAKHSVQDYYTRRTPLEIAVINGNEEIVKELLASGADKSVLYKKSWFDNRSALWHARKRGYKNILRMIERKNGSHD